MKKQNTDYPHINAQSEIDFNQIFAQNRKHPIKLLLNLYRGSYWLLIKSAFYYMIQLSPVTLTPIITANIINIAADFENHSLRELILNALFLAVFIIQNVFSTYLSTKHRSLANRRVEYQLRSSMARKLHQLSLSFHKEMQSGRIQSKIMRDVENVEALTPNLFMTCVSIIVTLLPAVIITIIRNPIVFLFYLIMVPIAIIMVRLFEGRLKQSNSDYRHEVENTSAQVMEILNLLPITKAHALEKPTLNRLDWQLGRMVSTALHLDKVNSIFGSMSWVVFQLCQLVCLTFTGILAFKRLIPIGDITMYQSYFASIINQINTCINLLPILAKGFESIRSIGDIMWAMDTEDNAGKEKMPVLNGTYEFKNVTFCYHDDPKPILDKLNLSIKKGETIALVGESGSGKTTILSILIGYYKPTKGQVLIDGKDITEIDLRSYRSHISVVPQNTVLFSGSIRDNITMGIEHCTEEQLQAAIRIANLEDMIAKLPQGLDTLVGEHGDKLSGGQRQRIAIARAVIRNSSVIFFDEATSALDTVSEKLIQDSIEQLTKDHTTFIVAHRLSTIRNADKIAVIKDGKCVEFGTWDELMEKKGEFYSFKSLQS